jgi:uncharacterized protein (DUF1697 family)
MADLRRLLERSGAEDVETYVQSGNAVLESAAAADELEQLIAAALAAELGLTVHVLVRSAAELAQIVRANPFAPEEPDPRKLHVTFLAEAPDAERIAALPPGDGPDRLNVAGREIYLHTPDGYGRSKLSNAFFERKLAVVGTTRNWRTVTALAELAATRQAT